MKTRVGFAVVNALLLCALLLFAVLAARTGCASLLLAQSTRIGGGGPGLEDIETFCTDAFLVTYELRRSGTARVPQYGCSVTVVATNSCYQSVLGYRTVSGGFFTAAAVSAGSRHAALNVTAAHNLFGGGSVTGQTFELDGQTWTVVGVLDDGDEENANLYLPAAERDGTPSALLCLLDGDRVSEAYAKTALKTIGVTDMGYTFTGIGAVSTSFWARLHVAWMAAVIALIPPAAWWLLRRMLARLQGYRAELEHHYPREIVRRNWQGVLRLGGGALLLLAGAVAELHLALRVLEVCLDFGALPAAATLQRMDDFRTKLAPLAELYTPSLVLFVLCLVVSAIWMVLLMKRRRSHA